MGVLASGLHTLAYNDRMFDRSVRVLFDQAAAAYDEARPGYPPELINKLIELAELPEKARILEIGCGTGQITRPIAERGYEIVAVELGEHLKAQVIHNSFEKWIADTHPFDLVLSAQAFHWIDPEIGYPKIRHLLKDSGQLAVVYNLFRGGSGAIYQDLDAVYRDRFPHRDEQEALPSLQRSVERTMASIRDSGLFSDPTMWDHPWVETYDTARYARLLESFSDHRNMDESARMQLIDEVRTIIDKHGCIIKRPLLATLFLASVL